jgi:uncharacterized integral membrane protein (TIGR00698 family)
MSMSKGNPYKNPELASYMDCCGYLPPRPHILETQEGMGQLHNKLKHAAPYLPGIALGAMVTGAGYLLAYMIKWLAQGVGGAPVSPILLAILIGLTLGNVAKVPTDYDTGLRWCARFVLRMGIVLLGLRLSLSAAGAIGWMALPLVLTCITSGLLIVMTAGRWLGLSPRLASLIAVGTGICGVSAIAATAPVIQAEDDEVSYAVGCITLFGLLTLLAYPWLSHTVFAGDAVKSGLYLGTAVHDTSQVTGAALLYSQWYDSPQALEVATVTKLLRNLFIVVIVPLMALIHRRRGAGKLPSWWRTVPVFVLLFVVMVAVRTVGDVGDHAFGLLPQEYWSVLLAWSKQCTALCLTLAMAAVGIGTRLSRLRRLGAKPLALGFVAAAAVGLISYTLIESGIIQQ